MRRIFLILMGMFYLFSCSNKQEGAEQSQEENASESSTEEASIVELDSQQINRIQLSLVQAKEELIEPVYRVNGVIDVPPQNLVSISMPMGGYLKRTKLLPGMHVNKGEVIATMEDAAYIELQQEYLMAKAKLVMLQKEYDRQQLLNESKASSDKVFQQAKEAYENAKITHKAFEEKLKLIGIVPEKLTSENMSRSVPVYAPIDGFVSKVLVNVGKYVNPTDILFELVNPEDIHLSLNIFEKDMEHVYMGMKVMAYTNSHPNKRYPCEVILIGKDIGSDRSINVHCHFESYDKLLVPGTYMNAELLGKSKKGIILPSRAIIQTGAKHYVFVSRGEGKFEKIEVETGFVNGDKVEVIPMQESQEFLGFQVVDKGAYTLWMKLNNAAEED